MLNLVKTITLGVLKFFDYTTADDQMGAYTNYTLPMKSCDQWNYSLIYSIDV